MKSEDAGMSTPQNYKLLLVDDDDDDQILIRKYLNDVPFSYSLEWIDNYEQALKVILEVEHDVYLIDHYLGAQTGIELLRLVRERDCRAPMIILTGRSDDGLDIEALDAGATDYLEKKNLNSVTLGRSIRYAYSHQTAKNQSQDLVTKVTRLEQLKTDMIRIAAHDLRTPLTVMRGYIEILNTDLVGVVGDNHMEYLKELQMAVNRMQRMVVDILSLERIAMESGGYTTPINFSELVKETYSDFERQQTHNFTIEIPHHPITVYGSEAELREAISNLISNAVKYTPKGGDIIVGISADTDLVLLMVKDNGFGIPKNQQEDLFKPFFRAKTKETRKIEGTGLGLHLVKNIVERHNGHIYFESSYNEGSTFGFMLPQMDS
jgi:signal transduction histidine kinase